LADVVLGFDNLAGYLNSPPYIGTIIGRYANRIAKGRFTLNGKEYQLAANNGPNHLHGGLKGFDKVLWQAKSFPAKNGAAIALTYLSRDGEEGYPGNLSVQVIYTLTEANELKIDYLATTDKDTLVNLTNHSYFNLSGTDGDILGHLLQIHADYFTPTDATAIPTGDLRDVNDTPFDFRKLTAIGERIERDDEQLKLGKGYDHNFIVKGNFGQLRPAAKVVEPLSGRVMEVLTTEPGVQLYSGNYLDGSKIGKGGKPIKFRTGFCLETQHFPDSPNQPKFPTTVLRKGEKFTSTTIYKFSSQL
jgi:aldose 1-epimerase